LRRRLHHLDGAAHRPLVASVAGPALVVGVDDHDDVGRAFAQPARDVQTPAGVTGQLTVRS